MYVYVSEQEEFSDFKNEAALFWLERGIVYGDWVGGPNEDGSFTKGGQIEASEVKHVKEDRSFINIQGCHKLGFSVVFFFKF